MRPHLVDFLIEYLFFIPPFQLAFCFFIEILESVFDFRLYPGHVLDPGYKFLIALPRDMIFRVFLREQVAEALAG